MNSKLNKTLAAALLASAIAVTIAAPAYGVALPYASSRRQINAGVLIPRMDTSRASVPSLSTYIFMVMDWRSDMKPRGWEFVNPLAPRKTEEATSDPVAQRWGLPGNRPIGKDCAAYWEVDLSSVTSANLVRFDVLYLCSNLQLQLTPDQRDKLRRFVDGGGLLWVDNGGGMSFHPVDGLFIDRFNFIDAGGTPWIPPQHSHHPVVSTPYRLMNSELGGAGRIYPPRYGLNPGYDTTAGFQGMPFHNPTILLPIIELANAGTMTPYAAGNEYGSGRVVATAGWVGGNISEAVAGGAVPEVLSQQNANMFMASPAALKLAYNIVNWAASYTGFRKNPRHTGYSLESLNPALVEKWKLPYPPVSGAECAPVIYKNCFFYVGRDSGATLFALDGAPEQDLDKDGNLDDGEPNRPGIDADIIWSAPLGAGTASAPILFSMQNPDAPNLTVDVVAVVNGDGLVQLFQALPLDGSGLLSATNAPLATFSTAGGGERVYAPTYHNGWLYVAGGDSRVYAINPFLAALAGKGTSIGNYTYQYTITELPQPPTGGMKSSPVVGFIHNKERGSEIAMVYTIAPPGYSGDVNAPKTNDRLYGFPVFVAGERLQFVSTTGNRAIYNTYLVAGGGTKIEQAYPPPKVWYRDPNSTTNEDKLVDSTSVVPNSPAFGQLTITLPVAPMPNLPVYATYALDYAGDALNYVSPRVVYPFPPEINTLGNIPMVNAETSMAFAPNGVLYIATHRTNSAACGSIYAFAHDTGSLGVGTISMTPKLKWAYHLHSGDPYGKYVRMEVPSTFLIDRSPNGVDGDGVNDMLKPAAYDIVGGQRIPIPGLQVKSSPAVVRDKLFVTATTTEAGTDISRGALFCFKANPDFVIRLNQSLVDKATGRTPKVRLWQPDPSIAPSLRTPLEEAVTLPDNMVNFETGTIVISDFGNGILRTHSSQTTSQAITNVFTPALPVWVILDQALVPPSQIDFSYWDNLLWFFVPQHPDRKCSGIHSSPVILGDQVYFTCDDGYIFAIDIETGKKGGAAIGFAKEDERFIKWKDKIFDGAASDLAVSAAGANRLFGVIGGDGLHAFENPTTLIADNRRILEVDGSSNITWACDSTSKLVDQPGTKFTSPLRERQPLNRPALARNFGPSDYLVVDAGNNQVIRMDKGGFVSGRLSRFYVPTEDELFRFSGSPGDWKPGVSLMLSGEPTTLRGPVDALLWVNQEKWKDPDDSNERVVNVVHWLIADTGNFRILDVVERFDMNRIPLSSPGNKEHLPELNWVTKTEISQKTFAFNSVQLVQVANSNGLPEEEIWAAVGNYTGASGKVGGSILRVPYRKRVNETDPFLWQYSNGHDAGVLISAIEAGGRVHPLANPRFAQRIISSGGDHLLLCDDRGVFEVLLTPGEPTAQVQWGITSTDMGLARYGDLLRNVSVWNQTSWTSDKRKVEVPLKAMKVQKLLNSVLITNSYSGVDSLGYRFSGEVFEVKFENGRPTPEITWYAPKIEEETDAGGQLLNRRQKFEQSSPLEQPMSAQRILW